jgi:hypothetical protein
MEYKSFIAIALIIILLTSFSGILNGIMHFIESLFGSKISLPQIQRPSQLTIYFSNSRQYVLGLANSTVINSTNTTISINNGFYQFDIGDTNVVDGIAHTKIYLYNMSINDTHAIISVKANDTVQYLNIGNGTFSVSLYKQLLNGST